MKFGLLYNAYSAASTVLLVGLPYVNGYSNRQAKRKGPFARERIIKSIHFNEDEVPDSDYLIQIGDEFVADFSSLALSDDGMTAAFGSKNNEVVQVFQYNAASDEWIQLGSDITETSTGVKVVLSADGSILAASGQFFDSSKGRVQVFQYSNGAWSQLGSDILGEQSEEYCGYSLSLNAAGNIIAFGCRLYDDSVGVNHGRVRVYEFVNGVWFQLGTDFVGEQASEQCGDTVDLSAEGILAFGCGLYNDPNGVGSEHGLIRVYQFADGSWSQIGSDILGEANDNYGNYGLSLSPSGDVLACPVISKSIVRVYQFSNGWSKIGEDISNDQFFFGLSLDLSSDATSTLIAGGVFGEASVYTYVDNNWVQRGQSLGIKGGLYSEIAVSADGMIFSTLSNNGAKIYSFPPTPSSSPSAGPSVDTSLVTGGNQPGAGETSSIPTLSPISSTSSSCCCDCDCEKSSLAKILFAIFEHKK